MDSYLKATFNIRKLQTPLLLLMPSLYMTGHFKDQESESLWCHPGYIYNLANKIILLLTHSVLAFPAKPHRQKKPLWHQPDVLCKTGNTTVDQVIHLQLSPLGPTTVSSDENANELVDEASDRCSTLMYIEYTCALDTWLRPTCSTSAEQTGKWRVSPLPQLTPFFLWCLCGSSWKP